MHHHEQENPIALLVNRSIDLIVALTALAEEARIALAVQTAPYKPHQKGQCDRGCCEGDCR